MRNFIMVNVGFIEVNIDLLVKALHGWAITLARGPPPVAPGLSSRAVFGSMIWRAVHHMHLSDSPYYNLGPKGYQCISWLKQVSLFIQRNAMHLNVVTCKVSFAPAICGSGWRQNILRGMEQKISKTCPANIGNNKPAIMQLNAAWERLEISEKPCTTDNKQQIVVGFQKKITAIC